MIRERRALAALMLAALAWWTPPSSANEAVARLHALFEDEWQRLLRESPESASYLGDARYNDRWDDVSPDAIERRHAADRAALARLDAIDRAELPPAEQLNHDLFRHQLTQRIEGHAHAQFLIPLNQRGGVQTADEILDVLRFLDAKAYEDWLARLRALPKLIDQTITLMRLGIEAQRLLPKVVMQRVPAQIEKQIVDDPTQSPFYRPFTQFPDTLPAKQRKRYAKEAQALIRERVVPAYRELHRFFVDDYLPACPDEVGVWKQPNGEAFYAWAARRYTTTALTPDEIHAIGLAEVERIRGEMDAIRERVGFDGDLPAFFAHLRSEARFYFDSGEELLNAYRALAKRIDPELPRLFGRMPRLPYGVRAIPDNIAPDTTTAYYLPGAADGTRAGWYYVNLYRPETRPKYEMEALTLHEAVPGHHFQIALAQELGELPQFRKQGWGMTAFVEGWALYAESLGEELGLYQDPYAKFGALTYEMWRAVRLVVDTGIHHKRWTRQQAIDFFMANAAKSELDIVNEIDRYIAWPGQALAYKIGQLKIRELRSRAESTLGERFDVRAFHDRVLGNGALPLDLLERDIDAWIAERKS
ncbi:DUF885 domain-containing protein [Sinimarinibacterium thermocellulolyticum]|uniref:DUF885 domain-containing protein n=1 Tax=Sinimarinibacterium thermocellulolyticum TaxID=3170016 RepID=A0ABV2A6W9_9GAMM